MGRVQDRRILATNIAESLETIALHRFLFLVALLWVWYFADLNKKKKGPGLNVGGWTTRAILSGLRING